MISATGVSVADQSSRHSFGKGKTPLTFVSIQEKRAQVQEKISAGLSHACTAFATRCLAYVHF